MTTVQWIIKLMELVEMAKLTSLVSEKTIKFKKKTWKSDTDFTLKEKKFELMIYGSGD